MFENRFFVVLNSVGYILRLKKPFQKFDLYCPAMWNKKVEISYFSLKK